MINYMTRAMVAQVAFPYAGQDLQPGDRFYATPDDERYLTRNGRARTDSEPTPPRHFVPAIAPIAGTSTLVATLVPVDAAVEQVPQAAAADTGATQAPPNVEAAEVHQAAPQQAAAASEETPATAAGATRQRGRGPRVTSTTEADGASS